VGAPAPPGQRKNFRLDLQRLFFSAPQPEQQSILGHFWWAGKIWRVGVVHLVVLACVLKTTAKLLGTKCTHIENSGYAYAWLVKRIEHRRS